MPPQRTKNQAEAQSATKKLKTTDNSVDEGLVQNPYTNAELWNKLGFYVRKEVFSFLDIRVSNRFCRANKSWKTQLIETNGANSDNKGIAFLDWRVEKKAFTKMNKRFGKAAQWPWPSYFQLNLGGITNLVLIGRKITPVHYKKTGKVFAGKKYPLKKVTFWGGRFTHREVVRAASPLQAKDILMQLMKCELHAVPEDHYLMTSGDICLHFKKEDYKMSLEMFSWNVPVSVQHLGFDETFKAATSNETDQLRWLFKRYDQLNLIWPYGEDQVAWLTASMELLEQTRGNVWEAIMIYYLPFHGWKWPLTTSFRSLKVPNRAYLLDRNEELTTVDCAFLARVISSLPEGKRPQGWTLPPHPIPEDFASYWAAALQDD